MVLALAVVSTATPAAAADEGRKACFADAKRLCPAQVKAFNRKAAEACMIQRIDETSPTCHAKMLAIRDQRMAKQQPSHRD
ncbi:hypothetical protein [Sphingomonas sp. BAUL-RG-20F-R05-02]|uniref:hypothetical protein n=1 Tax=Sphingomonas sp. BAUL-RG-20F-R05-02 TaxID=2914830 RepID=UPI001F58C6A6|nr:hypothetical protein [Sphingomonas sp. BAUL-RG-20F-R05-02]